MKTQASLAEDRSSIPASTVDFTTVCNLGSKLSSGHLGHQVHRCYRTNTQANTLSLSHTHKIKITAVKKVKLTYHMTEIFYF